MSLPPRVSCIIPTFNMARYLPAAVESALSQTVPLAEVIVVDDGSTDKTPEVLARFSDAVRLIRQPRSGVSAARNKGVTASTGAFLCFLDADDLMHPDRLATQLAVFEADPTLMFCVGGCRNFWSPELTEADIARDWRHDQGEQSKAAHISTWLLRRAVWDLVGAFDPAKDYAEDADWYFRMTSTGVTQATTDNEVSLRRLHAGNATRENFRQQEEDLFAALKAHASRSRRSDP